MPRAVDEALQRSSDTEDLSPAAVTDYLTRHPQFLADRPELLSTLTPPARWTGDTVVDLQQYMVEMLRGEVTGLRDCAEALIETSRSNMTTQVRTHGAVLELLAADSLATLVRVVQVDLPAVLDVDAAAVVVEPADGFGATLGRLGADARGAIEDAGDVMLIGELADDGTLFGPAGTIRSAACARFTIDDGGGTGLFALGSKTANAFHAGQGTELFRFLARVVGLCFRRHLAGER